MALIRIGEKYNKNIHMIYSKKKNLHEIMLEKTQTPLMLPDWSEKDGFGMDPGW